MDCTKLRNTLNNMYLHENGSSEDINAYSQNNPNLTESSQLSESPQLSSVKIEQYSTHSYQSSNLRQSCSVYEESNQNYQNENSWDQPSEYSNEKHSSETQEISSQSQISILNDHPQRNSILTQKLSDGYYEMNLQMNDNRDKKENTHQKVIKPFESSAERLSYSTSIEGQSSRQKIQEENMKKEESSFEIKDEKNSDSENSQKAQGSASDLPPPMEDCTKLLSYSFLDFNTENMSSQTLFCDIPFCLNNFITEAEGDNIIPRICSYNNFKKVIDIKTFRNGMMMDCKLTSLSNSSFNSNYLIQLLESKGDQNLYNLAQSIRTYYNAITNVTADATAVVQKYDQEFLQRRSLASADEKERILSKRDPRSNFYFKTYTINWENFGSPKVAYYGFSKGYCDLIGLSIQENRQYILRKGFLECFSQNDKIKVMLKTCLNLPWNMRKDPIIIQTKQKFITYDNIIITNAPVQIEFHNLSYDFDQKNNFKCQLSEFMIVGQVNLDSSQERIIRQERAKRDIRTYDDKNNDEMDLYYSKESQSFLERYYRDIYGERHCNKKQLRRCEYIELNL